MKTKVFETNNGVALYEGENGVLTSSNIEAVKSALMDDLLNDDLPFDVMIRAMDWVVRIVAQEMEKPN